MIFTEDSEYYLLKEFYVNKIHLVKEYFEKNPATNEHITYYLSNIPRTTLDNPTHQLAFNNIVVDHTNAGQNNLVPVLSIGNKFDAIINNQISFIREDTKELFKVFDFTETNSFLPISNHKLTKWEDLFRIINSIWNVSQKLVLNNYENKMTIDLMINHITNEIGNINPDTIEENLQNNDELLSS